MRPSILVPRRPAFKERDVEFATMLGECPTLRVWRGRLPTIQVVRAVRRVHGEIPKREAWWDVRLEADDGWCAEGEIVDVCPLIELDGINAELPPAEREFAPGRRMRRIVRWLLWDEIWIVRDRLWTRLMDAGWVAGGERPAT